MFSLKFQTVFVQKVTKISAMKTTNNYKRCRIPSVKGAGRVGKASTLTGGSTGAGNGSALDINGVVCAAT